MVIVLAHHSKPKYQYNFCELIKQRIGFLADDRCKANRNKWGLWPDDGRFSSQINDRNKERCYVTWQYSVWPWWRHSLSENRFGYFLATTHIMLISKSVFSQQSWCDYLTIMGSIIQFTNTAQNLATGTNEKVLAKNVCLV